MSSSAPLVRRGLISCLHCPCCRRTDDKDHATLLSDQDLPQAIYNLIIGFYEEAFDRLPTDTMPDLRGILTTGGFNRLPTNTMLDPLGLLTTGGLCLGLLDPVSNIILNTIALLPAPKDAAATASCSSSPAAKRPRRSPRWSKPRPGAGAWHAIATRSYQGLLAFLVAYFGCLTEAQASRYLYRADANLLLAVMLVQHDLYDAEPVDPESDRMQAALKWTATTTGHPSPTTLTQLMAIRLKQGDFELLEKQFSGHGRGSPLTVEDVREIHHLVHTMMRPMCAAHISHNKQGLVVHVGQNMNAAIWSETTTIPSTAADGWKIASTALSWVGTPISSLQLGLLPDKLQDCLRVADGQKHILKPPCGDTCDYLQSLKMYLHGMIHNLYVQALKLLPTHSGSLMRSILKAGHCYGSCDPLSNIIVNSIWYDTCGSSLPLSDRTKFAEYNDVLDPLTLVRPVVRSVEGLVKLALLAAPQSSVACAMEKLCSAKCVVVDMLSSARERNHLHEAAMAAGHPLPLELGELHRLLLLMPDERSSLLSFLTEAQTSGGVLDVDGMRSRMSAMWLNKSEAKTSGTVQAPQLCEHALGVVSSKRSAYERVRSWLRSDIEQVLQDYTERHFWGPNYKLDIILGMEESSEGHYPFIHTTCYHINFLATSDPKLQRTLFFAELWNSREPKPEFCCPLPYEYAGRCHYGEHAARKIVYPDDVKYIRDDITHGGTGSVDGILEMDLVYFSPELDVELAQKLNMLPTYEQGNMADMY